MTTLSRRNFLAAAAIPLIGSGRTDARAADQGEIVLPESLGPSIPPELLAPSRNWPAAQGNLAATRSAVGCDIDASNIDRLEVKWSFPIEASTGYGGMTANPLVIDDTVYLQDMLSNVFALERATGAERWTRGYDIPTIGPNGVAIAYGRLFACLGDTAEVVSLDAATGAEIWRVQLSNNPGEGIDMAPAVFDSTVYVSTVAGNTHKFNRGGTRGILFALDAATGATLWQFDTTTDNLWGNPRVNSGGGLWYPPSFDDAGGIYFGVANAAPWPGTATYPNGSSRPAPNDYASSIVALDRATGAIRWHYNAAPHDLFDHDFQNSPVLLEVEGADGPRSLAIGSGKTGTVVAIDRATGEVVWSTAVGDHVNDDLDQLSDEPTAVLPGAWGGVLTPVAAAFGNLFIPMVRKDTLYSASQYDKVSMFEFSEARGQLIALDAAGGQLVWETDVASPLVGGATIVNDLVVTAGMDGLLRFFDASAGGIVHSFAASAGINAPPAAAGELLVVAAAGPRIESADVAVDTGQSAQTAVLALGLAGKT